MRELIEGVTKIKWVGEEEPNIAYSLWKHKEGIYMGTIQGCLWWKSSDGAEFKYCTRTNIWDDKNLEFVEEEIVSPTKSEWTDKQYGHYSCVGTDLIGDTAAKEGSLSSVKSTGGSSKYYEITLPQWLLDKHNTNGHIMLEDLAEVMFNNNFNYVNVFKAQKRMFDLEQGRGKDGNTLEYDATKCKYYIDKQVEVFNRNKGE